MDFDIGTFIYILLTLVFIIIGSLGKKKKPQAKPQPRQEGGEIIAEEELDPFTDNFKKLFGDFDVPSSATEEYSLTTEKDSKDEEIKIDTFDDKPDSIQSTLDVPVAEEGISGIYKLEDHMKEIMENSEIMMVERGYSQSTFVSRALRDFDPRKALLYSEIFKPKYF